MLYQMTPKGQCQSLGKLGFFENQVEEWKETQKTKLWWPNPEDELLVQRAMEILEETSLSPEESIVSYTWVIFSNEGKGLSQPAL